MAIRTSSGRAVHGDYEQFGLRIFRDMAGSASYLGLVAFALTGRRLSREDELVLDDLALCSHVTEPRVWPIKLARLVATIGRPVPGFVCGTMALDSDLVGGRVATDATRHLVDLERHLAQNGGTDESLRSFVLSKERLLGFGVPVRDVDERVVALRSALEKRGRTDRHYWQLGERFWRAAKELRRVEVNIIGATAAVCLDLGFQPAQVAPLAVVLLQPTFLANALDGARLRSPELRRLPDDAVRYVGPAPRKSPRAVASEGAAGARER